MRQKKDEGKMEKKKTIFKKNVSSLVLILTFLFVWTAQATVMPPSFETTLPENESTTDPVQVNLPGKYPVLILFFPWI